MVTTTAISPMFRASLADAVGWFRGALRVRDRGNVPQGRSGEDGAVPPRRLVSALDADRGGRFAPPAADPSQATGRVKRRDNQLHRARVLEDSMGRAARTWQLRRCNLTEKECRDAPAERLEQIPRRPGPQ